MGDPKKFRRKYKTPIHPWQRERIDKEKELVKLYGFKNKKEIWKCVSLLKKFTRQSKRLVKEKSEQAKKEEEEIINRLKKYGFLKEGQKIDEILNLTIENIMDKRLQTIVQRIGLARTIKQARQLITHGHIQVSGKKTNSPSYLVKENDKIEFVESSSFSNPEHPERIQEKSKETKKEIVELEQ